MLLRRSSRVTLVVVVYGALTIPLVSRALFAQPAAEASYDRVAKAWSANVTLEAQFDQRITNALLGRTAVSRGTFLQQKPGRVSITFVDPVGDRIVDDGKSLWVYLPSSAPGRVMKLPANADGAMVVDLLGQLLDAPKRTFTITGGEGITIDGRATRRVTLMPRVEGTVPFQKAILWLDEKDPRPVRLQVTDAQGVERVITLTTWVPNAVLPKNAFVFTTPKGVKVITKIPGS